MRLSITVTGIPELRARLKLMNPRQNPDILRKGFIRSAKEISTQAKHEIAAGGRGKNKALPALSNRLTSRKGHLRSKIAVDYGPLPRAIEIGTDVVYGAVHEFGLDVDKPSKFIKAHKRSVLFGKKVAPYTVPIHFRMGHTAQYPRRPFMQPALDKVAPRIPAIFVAEWKKEGRL